MRPALAQRVGLRDLARVTSRADCFSHAPRRRLQRSVTRIAGACLPAVALIHALAFCYSLWLLPAVAGAAEPSLTAADILRGVREAQAGKREKLLGQLRTSEGKIFPFLLVSDGPRIRYQFQPPAPVETVQVRLLYENSQL